MTKSLENLVDGSHSLHVSSDGVEFFKVGHLQKCDHPSEEKVLHEVTATDDRRTIKAPVDFVEESSIDIEYFLDTKDPAHQLLQTSFEGRKEVFFQLKYTFAPDESRQFKGMVASLSPDGVKPNEKILKSGKISITGDVTRISG